MGFLKKLSSGLSKTRASSSTAKLLKNIFSGRVDEEFFEELEESLILADIGVSTSLQLSERLRERAREDKIKERDVPSGTAREEDMTANLLSHQGEKLQFQDGKLFNILVMTGVNGAGKTTTIGKLASRYQAEGKKVLLAAADTYRAAAAEQLEGWAKRAGVPLIRQSEGADPAAVVFDSIAAAKARKIDILIIDTAGRLQNKANLMAELAKIGRVIEREAPEAVVENLLVLDGGTGQNAISQARQLPKLFRLPV